MISDHASPLGVIGGVDAGGQNICVARVATQLAERGLDVDVCSRRDNPHLPDVVPIGARIRVIHVPAGPPAEVPRERLLPYMGAFADDVIARLRREAATVDLMHANFFMSGDVALRVKRRLGIPFVVTFHALGRVRRLRQGAADGFPDARVAIEDTLARRADLLIAECPQDADDLRTLYRADAKRLAIVPCGFDADEFRPVPRAAARARLGWPDDAFVVLQLGRLVPRKGIDTVIDALARRGTRRSQGECVMKGDDRKRVPVTGGAGFLGSHLCERLAPAAARSRGRPPPARLPRDDVARHRACAHRALLRPAAGEPPRARRRADARRARCVARARAARPARPRRAGRMTRHRTARARQPAPSVVCAIASASSRTSTGLRR